ncbi:hypothetical protein [Sulfurovum riftiae]|uniref:Serine kinase n=1 Tax=Sulfurovum riftiae TaxID=1630136 RepID=A0A151CFB0_9BACT|nr:hypothetical protein [Sulfurovum riftiae]KYJ86218.1 hypothetical protein AS592_02315 [Sulfurovum riftiae]
MIAYNHYIKFIPELENDKKVEGSFDDVVTVRESSLENLPKDLTYEITFFNNQGRDLTHYSDREFARTEKDQLWAFEVKGVVTFIWYSGTLNIEYIPHENFTDELLEYWCLHLMLPVFFTIEGKYDFLHAGAVEVAGKPILFMANSFGGKSTMTDFFLKQGHTLVSDDKVGIFSKQGNFFLVPSHPHHRPYRDRETLGYFFKNILNEPKKIHIIYELERTEADALIEITELNGIEKFKSLRFGSEINLYFLKDKRFIFLTDMAKKIPVFKVMVPWNIDRLEEVHNMICSHTENFNK